MRELRRADLGSKEIAYRTAQNLYSLHRSVRVTDPPKRVRQTISTVMPRAMSALPTIADICSAQAHVCFVPIADIRPLLCLSLILPCFRHQVDACGQRADRPPNGINQNYRRQQHNGLYSDAGVSAEIIEREKDATKK
jgi:hypothetical protein